MKKIALSVLALVVMVLGVASVFGQALPKGASLVSEEKQQQLLLQVGRDGGSRAEKGAKSVDAVRADGGGSPGAVFGAIQATTGITANNIVVSASYTNSREIPGYST